ncbi:hypothetical protein LOAG_02652 [Loa loa]|uniref:Uncharacterized protein n=1 Tax=Loa loa TaxID=7209 RepID=A0A1S0U608_LOALO|nr:hypothetical protein LOAG_02652 [Loa loa]EFO25839.1 hypothetical protein LOAG_02652 [Loa loa]
MTNRKRIDRKIVRKRYEDIMNFELSKSNKVMQYLHEKLLRVQSRSSNWYIPSAELVYVGTGVHRSVDTRAQLGWRITPFLRLQCMVKTRAESISRTKDNAVKPYLINNA